MTGGQEGVNVDIIDRLKNHTRGEIDELMSDADFVGRVASYFTGPEADTSELDALRVRRRDLLRVLAA